MGKFLSGATEDAEVSPITDLDIGSININFEQDTGYVKDRHEV